MFLTLRFCNSCAKLSVEGIERIDARSISSQIRERYRGPLIVAKMGKGTRKWIGSGAGCKALNGSEAKRGKLKRTTERNELGRFPPLFRLRLFYEPFIPFLPPCRDCGTLACNVHYSMKLIGIKSPSTCIKERR